MEILSRGLPKSQYMRAEGVMKEKKECTKSENDHLEVRKISFIHQVLIEHLQCLR